jgi:pimeloyl-ACP methyl ester carboxylesterase
MDELSDPARGDGGARDTRALAQSFANARYVPIEHANHYVQFDQPQAVVAAMEGVMAQGVAAP